MDKVFDNYRFKKFVKFISKFQKKWSSDPSDDHNLAKNQVIRP